MITRRYLRVKVMQSLYAFHIKYSDTYFNDEHKPKKATHNKLTKKDLTQGRKDLLKHIQFSYWLYQYVLYFLTRIRRFAQFEVSRRANQTYGNRPASKFASALISNSILILISNHPHLKKQIAKESYSLENEHELVRGIFKKAKYSDKFASFLDKSRLTFEEEREMVISLFDDFTLKEIDFNSFMESINLNWTSDKNLISAQVLQTLNAIEPKAKKVELYELKNKDWEENKFFLSELFSHALMNKDEFDNMIGKQAKNWDLKRITFIDHILMHMALSEMLFFDKIPLKVTIDEYIEIAKRYSTPKSKDFINGILDRLMRNLIDSGRIVEEKKGEAKLKGKGP